MRPVSWPAEVASCLDTHFGDKMGLENQHINQGAPLFVPSVAYSMITANTNANGLGVSEEIAPTLDRAQPCAVAFAQNTRDEVRLINGDGAIAGALAAEAGMKQQTYLAFNVDAKPDEMRFDPHVSATLAKSQHSGVHAGMQVRRLTPMECERLQGFPDGYTAVPHRGKPAADGPRYKALGNSMAVPVMAWIGHRIAAVDSVL